MGLGIKLKELLIRQKVTVSELARMTGISTNTLYATIRRDSKKADIQLLFKICDALNVDISELIEGDPISIQTEAMNKYKKEFLPIDRLLAAYDSLNEDGQEQAIERITELSLIDKYCKSKDEYFDQESSLSVEEYIKRLSPEQLNQLYKKASKGQKK